MMKLFKRVASREDIKIAANSMAASVLSPSSKAELGGNDKKVRRRGAVSHMNQYPSMITGPTPSDAKKQLKRGSLGGGSSQFHLDSTTLIGIDDVDATITESVKPEKRRLKLARGSVGMVGVMSRNQPQGSLPTPGGMKLKSKRNSEFRSIGGNATPSVKGELNLENRLSKAPSVQQFPTIDVVSHGD